MKTNQTVFSKISLLILLLLTVTGSHAFAAMTDYCVIPPFVSQPIPPNILIVLDNSYSMCDQAYPSSYSTAQFKNGLYYGYFEGATNYKYNGSRWEPTTEAMNTGTVANPIATGSFLNWATMRRTEVSKKLLIGGKANPRSPPPGQTVKLTAQTDCGGWAEEFDKTFDPTGLNLIYPFNDKYKFKTDVSGALSVGPGYDKAYPISDKYGAIDTIWWRYPTPPDTWFDKVDDTTNDDSNYIVPLATTTPIIFNFTWGGAQPAGTIEVIVHIRAYKSGTQTRKIKGVLNVNNTLYASAASASVTGPGEWHNYSFKWATNPAGGGWTWNQINQVAGSTNLLTGFGVADPDGNSGYNSGNYIYISRVYLEVGVPPAIPTGGPWNIIVETGKTKAGGLIQDLDSTVRFGLGYYNKNINNTSDNGGAIANYIGFGTPVNMVTSIDNMTPSTNTPLGETLYEMVRYFRQDDPYYSANSPADYSVGTHSIGNANIYRDPYAYKFTDLDSNLTNMYVPCAKSFILFLTDGESSQDIYLPGNAATAPYADCSLTNIKGCSGYGGAPNNPDPRFAGTPVGRAYSSNGSDYMIDVAHWARTKDMRPGTETDVPSEWRQSLPGMQNVFLYPIYMFGTGSTLLKDAAIYGGFEDISGTNKLVDCTTNPKECYRDSNGDGVIKSDGTDLPLTYYEGNDGYTLEQNIKDAISAILKRAASSTAVSVLSSSEGSGANLIQSLFYPKRSFTTSIDITWTSDLMNYWYYFDPYLKNAQIREDTVRENTDHTLLDLKNDYITQFYFDAGQQKTVAARYRDDNGDGARDSATPYDIVPIEESKAIWRAGVNLWWTKADDRNIKTSVDGSTLIDFKKSNGASLYSHLDLSSTNAADAAIDYVRGIDQGKLCSISRTTCSADSDCRVSGETCAASRNRTVPLKMCTVSNTPCSTNSDCSGSPDTCGSSNTWKLGDIISSTPRIMGPSPSNNFQLAAPIGYADTTYRDFVATTAYKSRQQVFVGANDGMFHAFRLGNLLQTWPGKEWWQVGKLAGKAGTTTGIGTENWAFIPKNALPYLQYLSNPDYCHINMVDGPVFMTDASIHCSQADYWNCAKKAASWRSIAIGSMGIGGATNNAGDTAACANTTAPGCIRTPLVASGRDEGWSSYFALDVTEQDSPILLWEFSNANLLALSAAEATAAGVTATTRLGVTNVGPIIVKVGRSKGCAANNSSCSLTSECGTNGLCVDTNGRWFAILASGSTGPIAATKDFKGTSNQNLWLFVVDLKTGKLERAIDTGIANAFAGSISSNTIDLEKNDPNHAGNYQDDAVYIGYVKGANGASGGVLRLLINDNSNPALWTTSKVIDDIGPVTTSVVTLLDQYSKTLWLYFAEGRYFYKQDDLSSTRRLFGIQEPCYKDNPATTMVVDYDLLTACTDALTLTDLKDQTSSPGALTPAQKGWYVNLDPYSATTSASAERVISNPTPDPLGAVYFLSFAPTSDICGYGGTTYLWALDYKTGGSVLYQQQGKALIQVSTGEIKELDLSDSTTLSGKDKRRSAGFQGIPPAGQGVMILTNPSPIKKFMHIQEQ